MKNYYWEMLVVVNCLEALMEDRQIPTDSVHLTVLADTIERNNLSDETIIRLEDKIRAYQKQGGSMDG